MFGIFGQSALSKALRTWVKNGGDLRSALKKSGGGPVTTAAEAEAVCAALDAHRAEPTRGGEDTDSSPLRTLAVLFQEAEGGAARDMLRRAGLPRLRPWVEDALAAEPHREDDVLFILKILAMYGEREDVDLLVRAARLPLHPDEYLWSVILDQAIGVHADPAKLVDALKDPLPVGVLLDAYLDAANGLAIAGKLRDHPFDTEEGYRKLEAWLTDTGDEGYDHAHSAAAALPFLEASARRRLLAVAQGHPDVRVRMEAAWAQVRSGDESGLSALTRHAGDPLVSRAAQTYLEELGFADRIPEQARDPDFQALAEMAAWLSHPLEFGRPPDALRLRDSRVLSWPPTRDTRRLWQIEYRFDAKDGDEPDVGVGMVGSITFALVGEATTDLTPEEIYGLHCCWELQENDDRRAPKDRSAVAGTRILRENGNAGFR